MAEIDNKKPEAPKPKSQPDDSAAHALTVFAQSLAYSAIEAPSRGAAQIVDHTFGTKLENVVQSKLNNAGIHKPEEAQFGTHAWAAEQFGSAIGMTAPMWLSRKLMVGKAEQSLVTKAAAEEGFTTALKHASIANKALRQASLSAKTGIIYGAVFTPTEDKNSSGNIVIDRFKQGFNSGATFGAMGYSSSMTGGLLNRTANSLESTALPSIFKSPLQTALHSSLIHGAFSGVPGGIIQAQLGAMENGKHLPTLQDLKENVVGMTMVGGAMGSASLFKEAPPRVPPKINLDLNRDSIPPPGDNLVALRKDSAFHPMFEQKDAGVDVVRHLEHQTEHSDYVRNAGKFFIRFGPIEKAWPVDDVNKYKSEETRSIQFAREGRESRAGQENWHDFHKWGVEDREVPVDVYRFPGLKAEIVVPTEYARSLDQVREQRLKASDTASGDPKQTEPTKHPHSDRILPEEIAQMLKLLPQSDIVHRVELLDHGSPWDMKNNHEATARAKEKGAAPDYKSDFVSRADANSATHLIRFFPASTNEPHQMQGTTFHEWSHLLQKDTAFSAFAAAARLEKEGFYAREYARKNDQENWAVHLGERFLGPSGANFAMIPEYAPARTLVMTKALRNMLDERADNPSPKHAEFLARTQAAELRAASHLTEGISSDIETKNQHALEEKLQFLNTAASSAQSPEILEKVLSPFGSRLESSLRDVGISDQLIDEVFAHRMALKLSKEYSTDSMHEFMQRWRNVGSGNAMESLFRALPEAGQQRFLEELPEAPSGSVRFFLNRMIASTKGSEQRMFQQTFAVAQENFEQKGLALCRLNAPVPVELNDWMEKSDKPQVRLAAFKNHSSPATSWSFEALIEGLPPQAIKEVIVNDAIDYVAPEYKKAAWNSALGKLPQNEQIELFRELGQKHDPTFQKITDEIKTMSATEFGASSEQIRHDSMQILLSGKNINSAINTPLANNFKNTETSTPENFKSSNPFDIRFDRIEKAWQPEEVKKYMTVETRPVDTIPENRSSLIGTANWNEFSQWGVERKDVPVNVYRFPGLQAEIVVPTEYARLLDQVREHRLKAPDATSGAESAIENSIATREKRVLPEEIAQMLKQMPHPDIVESVQLLDYADPWDLHASHVQRLEAEKKGLTPGSDQDFVALADATTYTNALGFLRFFESSTNKESELYLTTAHEWAHLAEKDVAFKAFEEAASIERDGFYSRKYALKNKHENWAVHLGERFLNPDGAAFAELPEKAPARTLIMAKALRNMLEARNDNPSLKHQELLARTAAAENLAGSKLRENILNDIEHDDQNALDQKLGFLITAATSAQSPEILARVLRPIDRELTPVLEAKGIEEPIANEVLARLQAAQLADNYSAEKMPAFIEKWKSMGDFGPMTDLFKTLPEQGQQNLMADLSKDQSGYSRVLFDYMLERTEGATNHLIQDSFKAAQTNAENHALELLRSNKQLSERYLDWLENSSNPDARMAASGYRNRQ